MVGHSAKPNSIRYTRGMRSICIDSGMVYGTASFLEIDRRGRFVVHMMNAESSEWEVHDMTTLECGPPLNETT